MSIESEARFVSKLLDNGHVVSAADRLREDLQNSRPEVFRQLVQLTDRYEYKNKRYGGDLEIVDYLTTNRLGDQVTRRALAVRGNDNYYGPVTKLICDLDQLNLRSRADQHPRYRNNFYRRAANPGVSIGIPFGNGSGIELRLPMPRF
jgi:hypothetical protein